MPNFLGWHVVEQTQELGAMIQLNSHTFKAQGNGAFVVEATPKTKVFSGSEIDRMVDVAGPKSKSFWANMQESYAKQLPVWENGRDMTVAAGGASADPAMQQVLAVTSKAMADAAIQKASNSSAAVPKFEPNLS